MGYLGNRKVISDISGYSRHLRCFPNDSWTWHLHSLRLNPQYVWRWISHEEGLHSQEQLLRPAHSQRFYGEPNGKTWHKFRVKLNKFEETQMGVSIKGRSPLSLVGLYFMENPIYKWMRTGGNPISGNLQMISMTSHLHSPSLAGNPYGNGRCFVRIGPCRVEATLPPSIPRKYVLICN